MKEETEKNYHCHNEPVEAKLRNALGAIYGLPDSVTRYEERGDDKMKEIMFRKAKTAIESRPRVKELLVTIEVENEKRLIQSQIDILSKFKEHPTRPGCKRLDIIEEIESLQFELKTLI